MITVTPEEWTLFEESIERAKAYTVLEMEKEAIDELRNVPELLQGSLTFLLDALEICVHFEHWDNAINLALELMQHAPENEDIRTFTETCLAHAAINCQMPFDRLINKDVFGRG